MIGDGSEWETVTVNRTRYVVGGALAPALVAVFIAATPVSASCGNDNQNGKPASECPKASATPELGSLLLFGTGMAGVGAYALNRFRARRRHDEPVESTAP
jgi:hypothetical protein